MPILNQIRFGSNNSFLAMSVVANEVSWGDLKGQEVNKRNGPLAALALRSRNFGAKKSNSGTKNSHTDCPEIKFSGFIGMLAAGEFFPSCSQALVWHRRYLFTDPMIRREAGTRTVPKSG